MDNYEKAKKYAVSICKKFTNRGVTFIELYKLCLDEINKIIENHKNNPNFDITKDVKLEWFLRQAITRRIADNNYSKNDPKYSEEEKEYLEVIKKYIIKNYKIPTDEEIAGILKKEVDEIKTIKNNLYNK